MVVTYRDDQLWTSRTATTAAEGIRRAGEDEAWAVVSFDSTEERDRFLERAPTS